MDLRNLKRGSKFQLTEDFMVETFSWDGKRERTVYDKGLVLSLVNLTINSTGVFIWFKVMIAKPIIKECYGDINPEVYQVSRRWRTWRDIELSGDNFGAFLDAFNNGWVIPFDHEYETITNAKIK